jgi:hypothetical protein
MARELVTRQGVGEQADAVWKALQMKRSDQAPAAGPALAETASDTTPIDQVSEKPATWTITPRPMEQMSLF